MKGEKIATGMLGETVVAEYEGQFLFCIVRNVYLFDGKPRYSVQVVQPCTKFGARIYTPINPHSGDLIEVDGVRASGGMNTATDVEITAYHEKIKLQGK